MKRRVLITGLSSYWGGRLAQELETRRRRSRRSSASRPRTRRCALERTEFVRVGTQHALLRRIVHAAEIDTVDRHAPDRRLRARRRRASPTSMNVIGTMNILAACGGPDSPVTQGRLQVLARTTTAASATTRASSPRRCSARTRRAPGWSPTSSRPTTPSRASPPATRRHGHDAALLQRPRAGPADQPQRAARPARGPRHPRLRPALPVHPRGRHRRRAAPRGRSTTLPGIHNAAPDGVLALSRDREPARQAVRAAAAAVGDGAGDRALTRPARHPHPRRGPPAAALRARAGQPQAQAVRLPLRAHDARDGAGVCRGAAAETAARERRGAISLRARGRGIPALVAECASRRVRQLTRQRSCRASRSAARPPTICGPDAYPSDRSRRLRGAPRRRRRRRRVLLRRLQEGPDRRGREGQRRPDRRA